MYTLRYSSRFLRDAKRCKKEGKNMEELKEVLLLLRDTGTLPDSYSPHLLREEYSGYWEAHIEDDWLIVWRTKDSDLELVLTATGSHKQLFAPGK